MQNTPLLLRADPHFDTDDKQLVQSLSTCQQSILLDVSAVEETSISAFNLLLKTQQRLFKRGQALTLISPSACIRTWLYITKLQRIIPAFPNLSIANTYIKRLQQSVNTVHESSTTIQQS